MDDWVGWVLVAIIAIGLFMAYRHAMKMAAGGCGCGGWVPRNPGLSKPVPDDLFDVEQDNSSQKDVPREIPNSSAYWGGYRCCMT